MSKLTYTLSGALLVSLLAGSALAAPDVKATIRRVPGGLIITPGSSLPAPAAAGVVAHTNVHLFQRDGHAGPGNSAPDGAFETPASLACVYGLVTVTAGCNPLSVSAVVQGGSKVVVIVDAYDDPNARSDLAVYSKEYGLPAISSSNFSVVYAAGTRPAQDSAGGWELEESLDIEMAHALAPSAKVVLVEAASDGSNDLLTAEAEAVKVALKYGGGEISNSWGAGEFTGEDSFESSFTGKDIVFFASTGDTPGTEWPSVLSNVVAVGGTTLSRDGSGNYLGQSVWSQTGGGLSSGVSIPSYQSAISARVGTARGVPDTSLVANPQTGVWVYDTVPYNGTTEEWIIVGGTSVASPATAAIVNTTKHFEASSAAELTLIYANLGNKADFTDVTSGTCNNDAATLVGWDTCTGVGTPLGKKGK
jgi:subtilase family serine protease